MAEAQQRYRPEEIREILRRAQRREEGNGPAPPGEAGAAAAEEEGLSARELIETAREVGFAEDQVAQALVQYEGERQLLQAQKELRQLSYRRLSTHAINYLLVNGLLFGVNLWLGPPFWFLAPLLFWGVFLLFHLRAALFPDPDRLRERARRRLAQRRLKESGKEFGHAVTRGAAELLSVTAKKIDAEVDRLTRK